MERAGRMAYLESVKLHVRIAVCQPFDHALHRVLGAVGVACDPVTDLHDGTPVLGREVLVRRLGYDQPAVSIARSSSAPVLPSLTHI